MTMLTFGPEAAQLIIPPFIIHPCIILNWVIRDLQGSHLSKAVRNDEPLNKVFRDHFVSRVRDKGLSERGASMNKVELVGSFRRMVSYPGMVGYSTANPEVKGQDRGLGLQ